MVTDDKTQVFTSWVVVTPAEDIVGVWVAHALEFDIISQGSSPVQALESVTEAVAMAVADDLNSGLDPRDRRAPGEYWERLVHVLKNGTPVNFAEVRRPATIVKQVTLAFERVSVADHPVDLDQLVQLTPDTAGLQLAA